MSERCLSGQAHLFGHKSSGDLPNSFLWVPSNSGRGLNVLKAATPPARTWVDIILMSVVDIRFQSRSCLRESRDQTPLQESVIEQYLTFGVFLSSLISFVIGRYLFVLLRWAFLSQYCSLKTCASRT